MRGCHPELPLPPKKDNGRLLGKTKDTTTTTTTTQKKTPEMIAQEQWNQAKEALQQDSSLLSLELVAVALTRGAPLHVLQFMLSLNPHIVLPRKDHQDKEQPSESSLHTAIQYGSPLNVIRTIIQACPQVLKFKSKIGETYMDPLSFARVFRSEDVDLLNLLEKPMSFWTTTNNHHHDHTTPPQKTGNHNHNTTKSSVSSLTDHERQELNNMKKIVASVVRAQKRQLDTMTVHTQEMKIRLETLEQEQQRHRRNRHRRRRRPSSKAKTKEPLPTTTTTWRVQLQSLQKKTLRQMNQMEQRVLNHEKRLRKVEKRVALASQQLIHLDMNHVDKEWMMRESSTSTSTSSNKLVVESSSQGVVTPPSPSSPPPSSSWKLFPQEENESMIPFVYATPYEDEDKKEDDMDILPQLDKKSLGSCLVPSKRSDFFPKIRTYLQRKRHFVPANH